MLYTFDKNSLVFRKVTPIKFIYVFLGLFVITFALSFLLCSFIYKTTVLTEEAKLIVMRENNEFSKQKFKEYVLSLNVKFPNIVMAQAELESSHFNSVMFHENNNMFGMKPAKLRPTTNKGENRGHAYFDSWKDCVLDYAFYSATYLNEIKTEAEYLNYLKSSYAEDPNYINKLKTILKKN